MQINVDLSKKILNKKIQNTYKRIKTLTGNTHTKFIMGVASGREGGLGNKGLGEVFSHVIFNVLICFLINNVLLLSLKILSGEK